MNDLLLQNPQKPSTFHRRQSLKFEECLINGERIKLPQALCENAELFQALFSVDSWNAFTEQQRRHLMQFLPKFRENENAEKSYTLKLLFSGNEFRFGSNPLTEFGQKLSAGYYQADIVQMQKLLVKARYKEYLRRQRLHYYKILKHSLITRHKLLEAAKDLQPGSHLPQPIVNHATPVAIKRKIDRASLEKRVKHRYHQELISIKKEVGDSSDSSFDDNYPEGFIPPPFTKKHRKQICQLEESFNAEFDQPVISTLSRPDCLDLSRLVLNVDNPFDITEDKYKDMLKKYQKHSKNLHPYMKTEDRKQTDRPALTAKQLKELKPSQKRKPRKSSIKSLPEKPVESIMKTEILPFDDFVKPVTNNFGFANELNSFEKKFEKLPVKQERLDEFIEKQPTSFLQEPKLSAKEELAMKEEQDNAVAALLKQEEREAEVNEYIKNEEKPSVLLFDEFDRHIKEETTKNETSDYLLTPESYNVALQSVINGNNGSPFVKKTIISPPEKSDSLPVQPVISEVENLPFEPLTIDTIAETPLNSPPVTSVSVSVPTMARISPSVTDLDNVSVMDLGNAIEDTEPPLDSDKPPTEIMHNAHTSFFSLIREIVCSTYDHRMDLRNLQKRVDVWYDNAVSPLNSWYTNQSWPALLQNAVTFLAGHCPDDLLPAEYVPYIEYKSHLDIYQWIGAGRDSDVKLTALCDTWLKNKDQVAARVVEDESILPFVIPDDFESKREQRSVSPSGTRFPTDWVVVPSTPEEREEFQKQERLRYQSPNTPFTYRVHGYQTVVGPVNMNHAIPSNQNKIVKGSSLLVENRPHYVTIMALVQDAAARLPNGEGSRQDIVTLIKDSQYLSENIMNCVLHGAVTSCLDRMQQEADPCVKYDARRKVWVYLHRSRTITDFEMADSFKPKTARKTAVWKVRRQDYVSVANTAVQKSTEKLPNSKETKVNVRAVKSVNVAPVKAADAPKAVAARGATVRTVKTDDKSNKIVGVQPTLIQAVIQDQKQFQKSSNTAEKVNETQQFLSTPTIATIEKGRSIVRTTDIKTTTKTTIAKTMRPSIIKKTVIRDGVPVSSVANTIMKTNISDAKSLLTNTNILSSNTIVKLINAKALTTETVKGTKTIAQISPQQIVVIKQPDDGNPSTDKKHTILLKQLQQYPQNHQHRFSLTNLQKCQSRTLTTDQKLPVTTVASATEVQKTDMCVTLARETKDGSGVVTTKQDALQQLLMKHQNELKLQQNNTKEMPSVALQQNKTLGKQMIVVKQNQGQLVAETQSVLNDDDGSNANQKAIASPLVILNKQQYQQQLQNSKHQIIQVSGQQLTAQQIQQMLIKQQQQQQQQQQQILKRAPAQQQSTNPSQQQQQQIVMLKPEIQTANGQQQIVMVKHQPSQQQQQLVMIRQATSASSPQSTSKTTQKQSQTQVIQIANSANIVSPVSSDLTKLQTVTASTNPRIQKLSTSVASAITPNPKLSTAVGSTIAVSVSKPAVPTYTVVALGQQQKVFPQNNQQLQILTSTSGTVNSSQAVVLPTTTGGLTLLQQTPMQQVLLPTGFNSPGMINLKTLQGLKVIPISAQNTGALRGQPVITRLVNSNAVRPVVIQEDRSPSTSNNSSNNSN